MQTARAILIDNPLEGLRKINRGANLDINPMTGMPTWEGERMDYGFAIETLYFTEELEERSAEEARGGVPAHW